MSRNTEPLLHSLDTQNNIPSISESLSQLEKNTSKKYDISINGLHKLTEFMNNKESFHLQERTQGDLTRLKESFQELDLNKSDTEALSHITDSQFSHFLDEVILLKQNVKNALHDIKHYEILGGYNPDILSSSHQPQGISNNRYVRACNPSKPHHHIDGCIVGTVQTITTVSKLTGQLCLDTIKFPYHTYQILSGKCTTNAFSDM